QRYRRLQDKRQAMDRARPLCQERGSRQRHSYRMAQRSRSTPFPAQLSRMLARDDGPTVFSAATLADEFDHPPHQKRGTTIGAIHKALQRAFAEGDLITFVDDGGGVLREAQVMGHGSKAVGQPQFFGRPGAKSPDPDFHPVTYEEIMRRGVDVDE